MGRVKFKTCGMKVVFEDMGMDEINLEDIKQGELSNFHI